MPSPPDPVRWYDLHATGTAARHESLHPGELFGWAMDLLPAEGALVLDVGAGSGRDSAWLAARGADVVAVEPSGAMRDEAGRYHPDANIRWVDDTLPLLAATTRLGLSFDLILLSSVWQHVAPSDRPRALRKLVALLKPGGLLILTLRLGADDPDRVMHAVRVDEVERLTRDHGLAIVRSNDMTDRLGRPEVRWTGMALRLPDDGTGALPLLRHVILNDAKSSTYKLALLRTLCRIADGSAGLAREAGDDHVALPLGLVALTWLRLYVPLLRHDLPQSPTNRRGGETLGFAKTGLQALLASGLSSLDLRVGSRFTGDGARAVRGALLDAADTIVDMPAQYMTYPNGGPVLPVTKARAPRPAGELVLDEATLLAFGVMRVPRHLWHACQRFSCWVEPALITEWIRLMRGYASRQDRQLDEGALSVAMTWAEPLRDVAEPRRLALRRLANGEDLRCVWSGKRLEQGTLDIDHCLPWAAWPCSDLWNLMPAHRNINQHKKRDRLPSEALLQTAQQLIQEWWQRAYLQDSVLLPKRFVDEARASLPGLREPARTVAGEDVFGALQLQRLRLRHDQQVPEWAG
ncbi:MAG: methyltransferase domain-containing protein [Janthinobacterium lividum]